ncbi:somatostatin receptor type 5-like [Saccoglossus kowalevskii]|uniref:Somatostatin receptor type 5-like n=1 Tax=Saccoglossus kowalevskii TaxID=10224 RepID=A0ABM0M332_SACKO|nr:PREDICTED: somatostatin receptor type 5-like [Saccoglossus kowalevskii]
MTNTATLWNSTDVSSRDEIAEISNLTNLLNTTTAIGHSDIAMDILQNGISYYWDNTSYTDVLNDTLVEYVLPPVWWSVLQARLAIAIPIFYGTVCLCGFIGNLLVILVILRFSNKNSLPNIFILNLAIADFLFMLAMPFLAFQHGTGKWVFGRVLCKLIFPFDSVNQFAGVFLLTAMSIDRHLAIVHPLRFRRIRTVRTCRLTCIAAWIAAIVLCIPMWIYTDTATSFRNSNNTKVCAIQWPYSNLQSTFIIYALTIGYMCPLSIICTCYFKILYHVSQNKCPGVRTGKRRGSRRIATLVIVAVITFAICWFPFYAIKVYVIFLRRDSSLTRNVVIFDYVGICLGYANSAVNPVIYTFVGRNFKENVVRLLRCCKKTTQSEITVAHCASKSSNKLNHVIIEENTSTWL